MSARRAGIPRDPGWDQSLAVLYREGYAYVTNRCRSLSTDIFSTRVMLRKAVCMQGREAAEQFYKAGRFTRKKALPIFALTLIQDLGSVMVLDGEDHRQRKAMFMAMMGRESLERLSALTAACWREAARGGSPSGRSRFFARRMSL